jgi:hypothetical protein
VFVYGLLYANSGVSTTGTVTSAIDSTQQLAVNCGSGTELKTFNQSGTPGIQSVASQWFYLFSGAGADLKIKTTTTETDNEFVCAGLYNSGNDTVGGDHLVNGKQTVVGTSILGGNVEAHSQLAIGGGVNVGSNPITIDVARAPGYVCIKNLDTLGINGTLYNGKSTGFNINGRNCYFRRVIVVTVGSDTGFIPIFDKLGTGT